jgi:hypothetical protein
MEALRAFEPFRDAQYVDPRRRVIWRRLPNWKQAIPARWLPLQRMLGDMPMINSPAFTSSGC